jgi:cytochrome P450
MPLSTKLDIPSFPYTDAAMHGHRFHDALRDLTRSGWLATGPYGCIVLDRESVDFFLRHRDTQTPGVPMSELYNIHDGPLRELIDNNILNTEGADHRRLRGLVNASLSRQGVEAYRPAMRRILDETLAAVDVSRSFDFISQVARPYPARVIASVIGAAPEDAGRLHQWAHWVERQFDVSALLDHRAEIETATLRVAAYVRELIATCAADGHGEDLLSRLLRARFEGDTLSESELVNLVIGLLAGGADTAQSQLGHMIRLFAEHPDQWALVREDPTLVPAAVDEVTRFEPVLPFTARMLLRDITYRDVEFPAGSLVMLCITAANRDESAFSRGWEFDITADRDGVRPISFGVGRHHCMGVNLARAELEEALVLMSARFSRLCLERPPRFGRVTGVYGLDELELRILA